MKAEEARKLTEQALSAQSGVVADVIKDAIELIRRAAQKGERSISEPCSSDHRRPLTSIQVRAAYDHLKSLGYKIEHYAGDHREPGDTWTVSW